MASHKSIRERMEHDVTGISSDAVCPANNYSIFCFHSRFPATVVFYSHYEITNLLIKCEFNITPHSAQLMPFDPRYFGTVFLLPFWPPR